MILIKNLLELFFWFLKLKKLGLIGPEGGLNKQFNSILSSLWSNNGDAISHQYAGTGALKVII